MQLTICANKSKKNLIIVYTSRHCHIDTVLEKTYVVLYRVYLANVRVFIPYDTRLKFNMINMNHCFVVSFMLVLTKLLKLESRCFHYKVALYHRYLPIKFDDDIQGVP